MDTNLPRCAPAIMVLPVYMVSVRTGSGTDESPIRDELIITPVFDEFVQSYITQKGRLCSTAFTVNEQCGNICFTPLSAVDICRRAYEMEKERKT